MCAAFPLEPHRLAYTVRERLKRNAQLAEYQQNVTLGLVERGRQRFASLYLGAAVFKRSMANASQ
jgi:hypothetical protein